MTSRWPWTGSPPPPAASTGGAPARDAADRGTSPAIKIGRTLPPRESWSEAPDWVQANERHIEGALARALARPSGGWYVLDASRRIGPSPARYDLLGSAFVAWRDEGGVHVAPEACPHMGASLVCAEVKRGHVVCPWHGLRLGPRGHGAWKPLPAFDDGVLVWAQLPAPGETITDAPILAPRPRRFVDAVIRMEAACEPKDIVANRLDPWHGAHFHPHSFANLRVLSVTPDEILLRVTYKIAGPVGMEVDATFHSPEPNTIVMTIVDGEGVGSVVETHATPLGPGRSAIIEATLATSERPGFGAVIQGARWLRPAVEARARKLWEEDRAYAERRFSLRAAAQNQRNVATFAGKA